MTSTPTANELAGRAIGALFFTGFGGIWLTLALYAREMVTPLSTAVIAAGLGLLFPACFWLFRQSRRFPARDENPAVSRAFRRINATQWITIALIAFGFARLHLNVYVISAITAIVGLHLFPLAKLFHYPVHYATAIALVLWAGISLLIAPLDQLQGITAMGTGTLLWLSAGTTLVLAARKIRSAPGTSPIRRQQHA
jgi:hypothetical protein